MTDYILPPEPAPGSIVVFGKDGSGFPVIRVIGHMWFRPGWIGPTGKAQGKRWAEVVAWHGEDDGDGDSGTVEDRITVHVLRDGETV